MRALKNHVVGALVLFAFSCSPAYAADDSALTRLLLGLDTITADLIAFTQSMMGEVLGASTSLLSDGTGTQTIEEDVDEESEELLNTPRFASLLPGRRQTPMTLSFKSFETTPYDTTPGSEFMNALGEQRDMAWLHIGGGVTKSALDRSQDIVRRTGDQGSGKDYWGDPANSKIVTLQDAYGGVGWTIWKQLWPGYILYMPGSDIVSLSNVPDSDGLYALVVKDPDSIAKSQKDIDKINGDGGARGGHHIITLYQRMHDGTPNWQSAEYVRVEKIEKSKTDTTFFVRRDEWRKSLGMPGDNKLFTTDAVAVVPMRFWSGQLMLNLSLESPVYDSPANPFVADDKLPPPVPGDQAGEWYARLIASRVAFANADGVEFDVGRWTFGRQNKNVAMDANNDGVVDHGYIDGMNVFGIGTRTFHKKLRALLGPSKIIQADSSSPGGGVRDPLYLNGIQMEAYPSKNDLDRFSEAFSHLRFWKKEAAIVRGESIGPRMSYPALKAPTEAYNMCNTEKINGIITRVPPKQGCDVSFYKGMNNRARIGTASAVLLSFPSSYSAISVLDFDPNSEADTARSQDLYGVFDWDEYHNGVANTPGWLGRPVSKLKRVRTVVGSYLPDAWEMKTTKGYSAKKVGLGRVGAQVVSVPDPSKVVPNNGWFGVRFVPVKNMKFTPGKEYTVSFSARGSTDWNYGGKTYNNIPRMLALELPMTTHSEEPLATLVTNEWKNYSFSFLAADCASTTERHYCAKGKKPAFGISEQVGLTELRDIKVYEGTGERYYREYENGIVLLNMSHSPWSFELPNTGTYTYSRIQGTIDPKVNNGTRVGETVTIPAQDALFLVKSPRN